MELEELQDDSVYYLIKDALSIYPMVNVTDSYPENELTVPTVAIYPRTIDTEPFELGNKSRLRNRIWIVDIYALNQAQGRKLGYKLLNLIENDIPVYNYDEGFPFEVTPSQLGCLKITTLKMEIIKLIPQLVDKLYYRAVVTFTAYYSQI